MYYVKQKLDKYVLSNIFFSNMNIKKEVDLQVHSYNFD